MIFILRGVFGYQKMAYFYVSSLLWRVFVA
jgi:hypothetical protein